MIRSVSCKICRVAIHCKRRSWVVPLARICVVPALEKEAFLRTPQPILGPRSTAFRREGDLDLEIIELSEDIEMSSPQLEVPSSGGEVLALNMIEYDFLWTNVSVPRSVGRVFGWNRSVVYLLFQSPNTENWKEPTNSAELRLLRLPLWKS